MDNKFMKEIKNFILKIAASLLVISIATASTAVVKTYKNEIEIKNIYSTLIEIKQSINKLSDKIDNLNRR